MNKDNKQNSDAAQRSELVPQHKRMAMGVPIDGKGGSGSQPTGDSKKPSNDRRK